MMKSMRRREREIAHAEALHVLEKGEYGVLSTAGEDGQPYGVPLSYVFNGDAIYFHCATTGHKLENIDENPRVSFCVVGATRLLPEKFSTEYESVIVFGAATGCEGEEKTQALIRLLEKYSPDYLEEGKEYVGPKGETTKVVKITIDHLSGKARR